MSNYVIKFLNYADYGKFKSFWTLYQLDTQDAACTFFISNYLFKYIRHDNVYKSFFDFFSFPILILFFSLCSMASSYLFLIFLLIQHF